MSHDDATSSARTIQRDGTRRAALVERRASAPWRGDDAQWSRRLIGSESDSRCFVLDSPQIETRNDGGPLSTMGCGEKDCDGTDGHGHGHGHGGDAQAHGHSHGDAGGDATPLIQDGEGKDGIVYYRAPMGACSLTMGSSHTRTIPSRRPGTSNEGARGRNAATTTSAPSPSASADPWGPARRR